MTNDVHSLIARLCDEIINDTKFGQFAGYSWAAERISDNARQIKDDAEKMLGLLLEAREALRANVGVGKWVDGPLGKKIAEFLEGK